MSKTIALVVAAGRGSRFGQSTPKQYMQLGPFSLLRHSLMRLSAHPGIEALRVVIHPDDRDHYEAAAAGLDLLPPVHGGASRQESVRLGLESLLELQPKQVLIHDGARPFPSKELLDRLLAALEKHPAVVPALPIVDTLKRRDSGGGLYSGPDRAELLRVQTPQGFHFREVLAAHRAHPSDEVTDDAAVAEKAGLPVTWISGDEDNFKVTTFDDLSRAESYLAARKQIRTGFGYDVHAFGPGEFVTLCGVAIPHDQGLRGHSDADAGLHALTDALLASIAAGDIGQHFPPSDPKWRGADSSIFLKQAAELGKQAGGTIDHLDVTLICEQPKIGPYRDAMRARVAEILQLSLGQVSIKATTTEGLGFTGRGEGIAAQALATVSLTT